MATKVPRNLRPYPKIRTATLVRRRKRGGLKWDLLRQPRPRIHSRLAWGTKTSYDKTALVEQRAAPHYQVRGSLEERIFYQALIDYGFIPDVDFSFQSSFMGGRAELGGLVADFLFPGPKVIINPSSIWHTMSLANVQRDEEQTAILASMGYYQIMLDPVIIHDGDKLDKWMKDNIMMLWGLSSQGLIGASNTTPYLDEIATTLLNGIEADLDALLFYLKQHA